MHIAITGISGYFGRHMAAALAKRGHQIVGIVRPGSRTEHLLQLPFELKTARLDGDPALAAALAGADLVIHSAAKVHSLGPWPEFQTSIIQATHHTLQAALAAGVPRFVQMSTVGVYGFARSKDAPPFADHAPHGRIHRWNYYSRAKAAAENLVGAVQRSGRMATTILRPTWMYGPNDTTVMTRLVTALRARRFPWLGTAENKLSIIHLDDALDAVARVVEQPTADGRTYNIAADELSPTQREFVTALCEQLKLPLPQRHLSLQTASTLGFLGECIAHGTAFRLCPPLTRLTVHLFGGRRAFQSEGLRRDLGWRPRVDFQSGIINATQWLQPA